MPALTADATPAAVATAILDLFAAHPEVHDQVVWLGTTLNVLMHGGQEKVAPARDPLPADTDPPCGTTLCVAGAAAHVLGWTLDPGIPYRGVRVLTGAGSFTQRITRRINPDDSQWVAARALGLNSFSANRLFYSATNADALNVIRKIAAGDTPNAAVMAAAPSPYSPW